MLPTGKEHLHLNDFTSPGMNEIKSPQNNNNNRKGAIFTIAALKYVPESGDAPEPIKRLSHHRDVCKETPYLHINKHMEDVLTPT